MDLAEEGKIDLIRIMQKDCLSRFGNKYLKRFFKAFDVEIEVAFKEEREVTELMKDFMRLLASFSGKFFRLRGYREQEKLLNKAQGIIEEKKNGNNS